MNLAGLSQRVTVTPGGCWIWSGAVQGDGYGVVRYDGRHWLIHRLLYTLYTGAIPTGAELDHTCVVRRCCNPAHLEPVTHAENMRRLAVRRRAARKSLAA